jgi:hypothetical protein
MHVGRPCVVVFVSQADIALLRKQLTAVERKLHEMRLVERWVRRCHMVSKEDVEGLISGLIWVGLFKFG